MDKAPEIRVLFVEDLETDRMLAELEMRKRGMLIVSERVDSEADLRKMLDAFKPDIIVSDYSMPSFDGMSALMIVRELQPEMPFIIVTGSRNEEVAVECMKAGADDYIIKENMNRLAAAIEGAIQKHSLMKEKVRTEQALRQSEERFRKIFEDHAAVKILVNAKSGAIVDANRAASQFYGWTREELKQMNIRELIQLPEEQITRAIEEVYSGESSQYEFRHRLKNGIIRDVEVFSSLIMIDEQPFLHSIIHDITDKKHLFNEIVKAKEKAEESDRLKSAFLANISHEIRTPMNGIMGFTELLKKPQLTEKESKTYISIIQKSGFRMLDTMNAIIDIAKIEAGQVHMDMAEIPLNSIMKDLYQFFEFEVMNKGMKLQLHTAFPDQQDVIMTDRYLLESIMTNLIKNAIKFSHQGYIEFGYRSGTRAIEFYVKDTGIGISKEKQQQIFDRFVQVETGFARDYEGSGLGLSITRAYVEMLGGSIQLESEAGKGSCFSFALPVQPLGSTAGDKETKPVMQTVALNVSKVLIAEDDDYSFEYISLILEKYPLEIIRARNGMEAVQLYRDHPEVQLILMDIKMPVMDGNEATRAIRAFDEEVKIIAQTAYAFPGDREKAFEAGCNDYITKPIKAEDLIIKMQ